MYKYFKRLFDILLSLILIIIFLIPMIIISIAIKIEDGGPVLFKQKRTGKNGRIFKCLKFRSMVKDNDVLNFKEEDKKTKVGKFIRKTSLDELPQLLNIFIGEMSFVGPRPWIEEYYNNFTEEQKRRVDVLPGLTGLAQVHGRNKINVLERIKYDLYYVDHQSFFMDIKVIFLTIKVIFIGDSSRTSKLDIQDDIEMLKENKEKSKIK